MSDMDPDGMDSEFEGEGDLESPENISEAARLRGQQTKQTGAAGSQDKETPIRSRRVDDDSEDGENEDEEDEDTEPRSAAAHPPYNRRESDRNRPSPPGDRRR